MKYRLMSKRPRAKDWGIRNDRNLHDSPERNLYYLEQQKLGWERSEPDTEYRLEQSRDGRNWRAA
jgi:hypothetical protein